MAAIRGKDTAPEMVVRSIAHRLGYRFRLHRRDLPGKPDLAFPGHRSVVFVHGCFWHQHSSTTCKARPPRSRLEYWLPKLQRNVERDRTNREKLSQQGWRSLVIWECETKDPHFIQRLLQEFLSASPASRGRHTATALPDALPKIIGPLRRRALKP